MAQLRDLIVNGASRLIGDAYTNKIQINSISAYSDSGKTTYGLGNSGQILKSDGTNVYWANDNNSGGTVTSVRVQASSPLQSSTSTTQYTSLNTTISFTNQNANTILAGPSSGSATPPSFRALVPEDIPGLGSTAIGSTKIPIYWDGDSFEQANGIFENLSYDYETDSSKNTLKIKVNNEQKTCELLMKELKIGDKTYYGNQAVEITATDLGLAAAMSFKGVTEEIDLAAHPTQSPVSIIGGSDLTPKDGDVVLYKPNSQEFVWSGGQWHLLGLASSFALQNHVHGNISNDGKLRINNAIVANKSVVTNSTGDIIAKEQHFIFKGTCATVAATAKKVVTCPDFTSTDLIAGAAIAVIFNITNTAAIDNLVLKVNTTDEKPIRYIRNNTISKIPSAGYLAANQTYLFHYDGTYWIIDNMLYDTNTNTLLRTYASTSTNELPLVGVSTNTSMAVPTHTSGYKDLYGGIPSTTANRATINLSTGHVKIPGGVESSQATLNKVVLQTTNTYGETLPSTGSEGQIFFQLSDPYYELPAGGTAGQVLVKNSNSDRDVAWSDIELNDYVLKSGDIMSGNLIVDTSSTDEEAQVKVKGKAGMMYLYSQPTTTGVRGIYGQNGSGTWQSMFGWDQDGTIHAGNKLYGAVWNDYAEFRKDNEKEKDMQQPGRCVKENGDGILSLTTKRLERGCEIISDTFGFAIGQDEENGYNTPIASSGRVLAYPYEPIEEFASHIGYAVCSGPNGTVSIMTDEEEEKYPMRAIGTISEIPNYEEWGSEKIKVNGRVWIRIR